MQKVYVSLWTPKNLFFVLLTSLSVFAFAQANDLDGVDEHGSTAPATYITGWSLNESWFIENASFRVAESELTESGDIVVTSPGTVLEKLDIQGKITIKANDVTIRDCRIRSSEKHAVFVDGDYSNITIEYNEIDGLKLARPRGNQAGICTQYANPEGGIVIRGNYIHGFNDAIKIRGETLVEYNYVIDNGKFGGEVHSDGIQSPGITINKATFSRNWIDVSKAVGGNSAIILEVLNGKVSNILIKENYLNGGNFTVYIFTDSQGSKYGEPTDVWLVDNAFGRDYKYGLFYFRNESNNKSAVDNVGNGWGHIGSYWYNTGLPVTFNDIPLPLKDIIPTGLKASNITASGFNLSWIGCIEEVNASGYKVYIDGANPLLVSDTYAKINNLEKNTTYSVTVSAVNKYEDETEQSAAISVTTKEEGVIEYTSSGTWQTFHMPQPLDTFAVEFDAIPNGSGVDALTGILAGTASEYDDVACIVRFNSKGQIDARNGDKYSSTAEVDYIQGHTYHFRMTIDIGSHIYSVYVTPEGQSEVLLASNFNFRTAQQDVESLSSWAVYAFSPSHTVFNMSFSNKKNTTLIPAYLMEKTRNSTIIYPNPIVSHFFTIDLSGFERSENIQIQLSDICGKIVYSQNCKGNKYSQNKLNIEYQFTQSGIYFLTLQTGNMLKSTKFVVK